MAVCWRGLLLALCCAGGSTLMAGERNLSASVAPVCARGECRPVPHAGARVQGALLQAAALSVASGPRAAQTAGGRVRDLPRRNHARLPSWYRRAQAAQLQGQSPTVAAARNAAAPPRQARVRESPRAAATAGHGHVRSPTHLSTQKTTPDATMPTPLRSAAKPRTEARGARHRRLIEESMAQLTLDEPGRQARQVADGSSRVLASTMDDSFSTALPQPTPSFSEPEPGETSIAMPVFAGTSGLFSSSERTVASSQGLSMSTSGGTAALPAFSSSSLDMQTSATAVPEPTRTMPFSPTGSMSESVGPLTSSSLSESLSSSSSVASPPAPTFLTRDNLSNITSEGIYSVRLNQEGDVVLFNETVHKANLTLTDSHIETNGSIYLFKDISAENSEEVEQKLRIVDSILSAGKNVEVVRHGSVNDTLQLEIENSQLHASGGNFSLVRVNGPFRSIGYFSGEGEISYLIFQGVRLLIEKVVLTAKENVGFFADPMLFLGREAGFNVAVHDSSVRAEAGFMDLFNEVVEPPPESQLSNGDVQFKNATLTAGRGLTLFRGLGAIKPPIVSVMPVQHGFNLSIKNNSTLSAMDGDVILQGGVGGNKTVPRMVNLTLADSTLSAEKGSLLLLAGKDRQQPLPGSLSTLDVDNSRLSAGGNLTFLDRDLMENEILDLDVRDSRVTAMNGNVALLAKDVSGSNKIDLGITNSTFSATGGNVTVLGGELSESKNLTLAVDNSTLSATDGNVALLAKDVSVSKKIDLDIKNSTLSATGGNVTFLGGKLYVNETLDLDIDDSTLSATDGSVALLAKDISGSNNISSVYYIWV